MNLFHILILMLFNTSLNSGQNSTKPQANFLVVDKDSHGAIENCQLIDYGSSGAITDADGKCSIKKPEGDYVAEFAHPSYVKKRVNYKTEEGKDPHQYRIELDPIKHVIELKNQIKDILDEKSLDGLERIKGKLEKLKEIYTHNGYPELYNEYVDSLKLSN
jgi:hypothetical protein